jgi:hypothetical protein
VNLRNAGKECRKETWRRKRRWWNGSSRS